MNYLIEMCKNIIVGRPKKIRHAGIHDAWE